MTPHDDQEEKLPETLPEAHDEIRKLHAELEWFRRQLFGAKSEKRPPELLGQTDAFGQEETPAEPPKRQAKSQSKPHGRRNLEECHELPILKTVVHDVEAGEKICPCCSEPKKELPAKISWRLGWQRPMLYRIKNVRMQYGCSTCCEAHVSTAEKPMELLEGSMADASLLAEVIVAKYADHLPLYRQQAVFARYGIDLTRSTLCRWVMDTARELGVVVEEMNRRLVESRHLHVDETTARVMAPQKTRTSYLWAMVGGSDAPFTVYHFTSGRGREGPEKFLEGFTGILQSDAYSVYEAISKQWALVWAGCWAHARRKFMDAWKLVKGALAQEALERIGCLYQIERTAKSLSDDERSVFRREHARPLLDAFFGWAKDQLMRALPQSPAAQALSYALNNEVQLRVYLEHGYVGIDNNPAERSIRPLVVNRKNSLFCGNDAGGHAAAVHFSLIESAKRHGHNVYEYLEDLIRRLPAHPKKRLAELLPDAWKPLQPPPAL